MGITIAVVVLLAIVGSVAWLQYWAGQVQARQVRALARLLCPSCGAMYGIEASRRAQAGYSQYCEQQRKQRPDARINFATRWRVHCPKCGLQAQFDFVSKHLLGDAA
jgi:hypothetical protein